MAQKEVFWIFKGSTCQIYVEWQEIPCIGRYGGLSWQDSLVLGFGCMSELYTQYEFLVLAKEVFEANI